MFQSANAIIKNITPFIHSTSYWLNKTLKSNFDCDEAISSGITAAYKAITDHKITTNGMLTLGAKTYIRREMLRAGSPSWMPYYNNLIDYGYKDGRRGAKVNTPNRRTKWNRKQRKLGLCCQCCRLAVKNKARCSKHLQMDNKSSIAYQKKVNRFDKKTFKGDI